MLIFDGHHFLIHTVIWQFVSEGAFLLSLLLNVALFSPLSFSERAYDIPDGLAMVMANGNGDGNAQWANEHCTECVTKNEIM